MTPPYLRSPAAACSARPARAKAALFEGVFLGGFECSCHLLADGRRLDLLKSTRHAELAHEDYSRLRGMGMTACRDGAPWAHVEPRPGSYDFAAASRMLHAAERCEVRVIWDLMHFGWPDDVDVFRPGFPRRFAAFAGAFARWLAAETDAVPFITPVNEMSFLAWAGGDVRAMHPFEAARGVELKVQLVRATIEAIEAIRDVLPHARFLQPEPLMNLVADDQRPKTWRRVESDNLLQYQAWDMLTGRAWYSLGGHPKYLDILGVNFYPENQFMLDGTVIERDGPRYRPFSAMLIEAWRRYQRPMIISETGTEGEARPSWLSYVCDECVTAMRQGCELHGVTLYPIVDHPGWADDRHCQNGLWGYADEHGGRSAYLPLADEVRRQAPRLWRERAEMLQRAAAPGSTAESRPQ